jgi:hypothetical protein
MDELTGILAAATAAIEPGYFRLNIDGGSPVYRERVYCYELYHQMRSRWPDGCPFWLNGEIDKAAHPILAQFGADLAKPDLLIHRPGYMAGNYAIIEVKSARAPNAAIGKDIEILSLFRRRVGYERAIYLIYGEEISDRLLTRVRKTAHDAQELAPIELWLHPAAHAPAFHRLTLGG